MPKATRKVFVDQATCLKASDVAKEIRGATDRKLARREDRPSDLAISIADPDIESTSCNIVIEIAGKPYRSCLRWKAVEMATHHTLDCPMTGERKRKLYILDGRLGSREALGLKYVSRDGSRADQRKAQVLRLSIALNGDGVRKAARGRNRERILSKMFKLDQDLLDERDRRAVAKWLKMGSCDVRPMEDALGVGLSYYHMFNPEEVLASMARGPSDLQTYATASRQRRGRFPMISLTALCAFPEGCRGPGWALEYDDGIAFYAVCDDGPHGTELQLGRQSSYQTFPLARVNGQLQTPCPVTGHATGELYFRHGRWASLKAQRLT